MKKYVLGLIFVLFFNIGYVANCSAKEIIIDAKSAVQLDDKDIAPISPSAYKHVEQKDFDVKLNNPQYIKDIPPINNRNRKFDLQLKRPSILPYQSYQE